MYTINTSMNGLITGLASSILLLLGPAISEAACCWTDGKIETIRHQGSQTLIAQENRLDTECGSDNRYYSLPTDSQVASRIQSLLLTAYVTDAQLSIRVSGCVSGRPQIVEATLSASP